MNTPRTNEEKQGTEGEFIRNFSSAREKPRTYRAGAVVGIALLFAMLLLGALYIYGQRVSNDRSENPEASAARAQNEETPELDLIEEDLGSLEDFDEIGADLEAELNAGFGE